MKIHVRLVELQLYMPNIGSQADVQKGLGLLKHYLKGQQQVACSVAPYQEPDRVSLALTITGYQKTNVEQESQRLLEWIESSLEGQTLSSQMVWL
ncbi:hypothetical protein KO489_09085 [Reinekea forsetii]|nr:hypothetical protein [Reinekea forsetii]